MMTLARRSHRHESNATKTEKMELGPLNGEDYEPVAILRNVPSSSMICSRSWHPAPMPVAGWSSCRERETDRTVANSDTARSSAACTRSARGQGGCSYCWQGSFRPSCHARACGRRTVVSRRGGLGELTAVHKWWWSAVLPVLATRKDGVARDKEARAVHGEPR